MATDLISYKVFIASPGGLSDERINFRENLEQHNKSDGYERGVHFHPAGWEDTLGGVGRPQALINAEIEKCDYFILILHDRWGTSPGSGTYTSGTEEEFHVALNCFNDKSKPMKQLVLLFKDISPDKLSDAGPQLSQVLAFRKQREEKKDLLYTTFDTLTKFSQIIFGHLARWVREHEQSEKKKNSQSLVINTNFDDEEFQWLKSYNLNGEWNKAIEYAHKLLKDGKLLEADFVYSQVYRQSSEPEHAVEYGKFLRKQYKFHHAKEVLTKAIQMATNIQDKKCLAYATRQLGRVFEFEGKIPKALDEFQKALTIYESINNIEGIARTNMDIGFAFSRTNQSEKAIEHLFLALEKFNSISDKKGIGQTHSYLGLAYKDIGDLNKSEYYHLKALESFMFNHSLNQEDIAATKSNLGVVKRLKNEYPEAIEYHKEAISYFEKGGDLRALSREYSNIGVIHRRQKRYDEAILMHEKSLEFEEETLNEKGKGIQFSNLGMCYMEKHEYEKADLHLNQALKISKALGDVRSQALQFKHLARLALLQQELNTASELAHKSLKIDLEGKNKFGQAESNRLLGDILKQKEDLNHKEHYLIALNLYRELNLENHINELEQKLSS